MASEVSTIQSLKAVDAWIDVINANINGGVRTAFKSSRLRFSGSNVDIQRAGGANSLPLQMPEAGLTTANTVIDFTQGAVTASTENTHLAIQGEGFFMLASPNMIGANGAAVDPATVTGARLLITRDGEFRTNQNGLLVHSSGYFLVTWNAPSSNQITWSTAFSGANSRVNAVYNNIDNTSPATVATRAIKLSDYIRNVDINGAPYQFADNATTIAGSFIPLFNLTNKQNLRYSQFGSTVYDMGFSHPGGAGYGSFDATMSLSWPQQTTVLTKSLEASNASMTQSVPELSLAQKLFSALTKVLQTKQTNVDGVLNLVR